MAYAPLSTYHDMGDGSILGQFVENDHGETFEFSSNKEDDKDAFPHLVWVTTPSKIDCGYRRAIVKQTVAYVVIDENEDGSWVVDKWQIKRHRLYEGG